MHVTEYIALTGSANEKVATNGPHAILSLEKIAANVREEVKESMMLLSFKLSEISKMEKNAWCSVGEMEVKAVETIKDVDQTLQKQVIKLLLLLAKTKNFIVL